MPNQLHPLPTRTLPRHPDLDQLKHQAKELLEAFRALDPNATEEVNRFHGAKPLVPEAGFALHDAQLVLARAYGYSSWPKLKAFVDGVTIHRLNTAVQANDQEQVRAMLRVRPELINMFGTEPGSYSPLHHAVLTRNPEMVRLLVEAGANPHTYIYPNKEATTSIMIATDRGYEDILEIFRSDSATPPATIPPTGIEELQAALNDPDDEEGMLVIGVLEKFPDLIQYRMPGKQITILHLASALLLPRLAAWLLDHGASLSAETSDGKTPVDVIGLRYFNAEDKAERTRELSDLMSKYGAEKSARAAVIAGDLDTLRTLHGQHNLSNWQDDDGGLLALAVDSNQIEVVKLLLELGLDPDARVQVKDVDQVEFTWGMPLYQCARYSKHEFAELLLKAGADPNGQVYASGTPLSEAYGQIDERMIAMLEQYGGKSNPSMAGLYRRKDLALRLLAEHGPVVSLPDDGFGKGTVPEQLVASAARGGDPEILQLGLDHLGDNCPPPGDPRWFGLLSAPLGFWNHWYGPWCHQEWDRTTYLTCFRKILEHSGPPIAKMRHGVSILHLIVNMGDHVTAEERVAFASAAIDAGAPLDLRDDLLLSTPLGWASRRGRPELVRIFLERGADPHEPESEPWAKPLAWAESKGHNEVIQILKQHMETR